MSIPQSYLKKIVGLALEEDIGRGDITTDACIHANLSSNAALNARQDLIFCGGQLLEEVYKQIDPQLEVTLTFQDGQSIQKGWRLATLAGRAVSILKGERVALNFLQRLCGIATLTQAYSSRLPEDSSTRITDTRKTTPGLRLLERYAVRCGGGYNHRMDLSSAVLIKDNHIAACGSIKQAVDSVRISAPHTSRITCEVDNIAQLEQALEAGVDIVMLDNFDDNTLNKAVKLATGKAMIEVSGNISPERVFEIAQKGVDVVSVGRLTHSATAADLGLDWDN